MNMVGAASRDVVEGCVVVMDEMALLVRWIGDEGTKASAMEKRAARASAERRTIIAKK